MKPKYLGAFDIGGTKIETRLYSDTLELISQRRRPTPTESYTAFTHAIAEEVSWLDDLAQSVVPIGIALPGVIDPKTGRINAGNLAANGATIAPDLQAQLKRDVRVYNDAQAFALSEANGGAGMGAERVFAMILGTGIGGSLVVDGKVHTGFNGLLGEVGHIPMPAAIAAPAGLPLLQCGCGRMGCVETYGSGPGLSRIVAHIANVELSGEEIAASQDPKVQDAVALWIELLAETITAIQFATDPEILVLGGGLSHFPQLVPRLEERVATRRLKGAYGPEIRLAAFGDASGGRGAAIGLAQHL